MKFRVVLIFPDTTQLAAFLATLELSGEVDGAEYSFVGVLTEEQIRTARLQFQAYVRVLRVVE